MRFRAKCTEPGQMIALSRVCGAVQKLTKAVVFVVKADKVQFIMPTSAATFSNASTTSRCLSALLCELDVQQMFTDYNMEAQVPEDDGIYMHLDTESLARAFVLKSGSDRSLSFTIKLAKMGEKPCLVVRREQLSTCMPDAGVDGPDPNVPGANATGFSSFFLDHKLGIEWVARRHWGGYRDLSSSLTEAMPPYGIGLPNDLRHLKIVIDRFCNLSKDGKTVADVRISPRRQTLSFNLHSLTFDADCDFSDMRAFNISDYNQTSIHAMPLQNVSTGSNNRQNLLDSEFEAQIDLKRLGEALGALDKITQQSLVPATLALLGLRNRKAIVLVAMIDVGVQALCAINTIAKSGEEEDFEDDYGVEMEAPIRRQNANPLSLPSDESISLSSRSAKQIGARIDKIAAIRAQQYNQPVTHNSEDGENDCN